MVDMLHAACGPCTCLDIGEGLPVVVHIVAQAQVSGGHQADELDGEAQQAAGRRAQGGAGRGDSTQKQQRQAG